MSVTKTDRDAALEDRYTRRAEAARFRESVAEAKEKIDRYGITEPMAEPVLTPSPKSD